ncbi:nucleoside-diphosphate sugar epimerase/dehydratase [Limnobacter sp.]|uniref:polysaccharide biosynthesis protein n=1 Tax=Limnobacter sp. TaxID=2003368 RepID=UPI0027B91B5E|nr:nucleoside-diphosphate sugar epimerase/dehydratase [Limnobacter sp.]
MSKPNNAAVRMSRVATALPRSTKQIITILVDFISLFFAVWGAYCLRLGYWYEPSVEQFALFLLAPLIAAPIFVINGLYRSVIRYVGEQALLAIVKSMGIATLLWTGVAFMTEMRGLEGVPRSVPLLYFMLATGFVAATRFGARWLLWLPLRKRYGNEQILIFGAGQAGHQLATSLLQGDKLFPAAFVDDNPNLVGKDLGGLRVHSVNQLPWLIEHYEVSSVIVCLPDVSSEKRREVVELLEQHRLKVRILPGLSDIVSGRNLVSLVREVDVGDLLGRDPIAADPALLHKCITGKVVLVTGSGGSIGSELSHQIAALSPKQLILLDHSEPSLYQVHRKVEGLNACPVVPCLGSVADADLIRHVFKTYHVQTVYHAAAHKHVPLVESNISEGVKNNILGTQNVAQAAAEFGSETFVLISTDKAVRPTNVMGSTKRWAELAIQQVARSQGNKTIFCAVRFGNVLGSSGSVIPLFKEQIQKGGPITVTHPEINRFFMSIHEAVELVIQAGSMAQGGEVFLLDMGESVKIVDLAKKMISLAGLTEKTADGKGDIEIQFTGLRPGEKLFEELLIDDAGAEKTAHPKIMRAHEAGLSKDQWGQVWGSLLNSLQTEQEQSAKRLLLDVANNHFPMNTLGSTLNA